MTRGGWRILLVPLLLVLLGGLIASARVGSTCADARKTDEELVQIAEHDLVRELREAAARALVDRLDKALREGEPPAVDYLEDLARSPSLELRQWVPELLGLSIMVALSRGEISIDQVILGIYTGETPELRFGRAWGLMLSLFAREVLGLSPESFVRMLLSEHARELEKVVLPLELTLDLLQGIERLLRGEEEMLWGYYFDGSSEAIRYAALTLATLVLSMGIGNAALQFHPCEGWLELAERGETMELRWLASYFYFVRSYYCPPAEPQALRALAVSGASYEVRFFAAALYVKRELGWRRLDLAGLIDLTIHGESEELRMAASVYLSTSFIEALLNRKVTADELYELALKGETRELRQAAGWALGSWWHSRIERRRWPGWPAVGELTIWEIPRLSPAEARSVEQALIIFAVENTIAHPELAQAAILPLSYIWGQGE